MIFVIIGVISALIVNGFGFPVNIYPFLLPIFIVESRLNGLLCALGAGIVFDLMRFSLWPRSTLWFVVVLISCGFFMARFLNKRQILTIIILIVGSMALIGAERYIVGAAESVPHLILALVINEMIALGLFGFFSRWSLRYRTG